MVLGSDSTIVCGLVLQNMQQNHAEPAEPEICSFTLCCSHVAIGIFFEFSSWLLFARILRVEVGEYEHGLKSLGWQCENVY